MEKIIKIIIALSFGIPLLFIVSCIREFFYSKNNSNAPESLRDLESFIDWVFRD